jgi:Putative Flp pilus-assembly TadE/G-like
MARAGHRTVESHGEAGQATLLMLGVLGVLLAGLAVLFGFGNALGAKGRHQRAADLAAISAAQVMRDLYPRLFEPPLIESDVSNPQHLEEAEYRELAVAAAIRGARRNGVQIRAADVTFPRSGFAPTHVTVRVRGQAPILPDGQAGDGRGGGSLGAVPIRAHATAELLPAVGADGLPSHATGGGYDGPLAYRQGKPMR